MSRLGQFLKDRGLLTLEQLETAREYQEAHGARLGTNLVELRMLSIERLAEALSEFHRVPLPPRAWLEKPRRSALQRVTRPLVERKRFIPMRVEGNVMHAALLDPTDPGTLDDLRFATGCRIEPYVLPEIWMHDWLLALFKIPRALRDTSGSATADPPDEEEKTAPFVPVRARPAAARNEDDEPVPAVVPPTRPEAPRSVDPGRSGRASVAQPAPYPGSVAQPAPRVASVVQPAPNVPPPPPPPPPPSRLPQLPAQVLAGITRLSDRSAVEVPKPDGASVRPPAMPVPAHSLSDVGMGVPSSQFGGGDMQIMVGEQDAAAAFWEQSPSSLDAALPMDDRPLSPPVVGNDVQDARAQDVRRGPQAMTAGELSQTEGTLFRARERERVIELGLKLAGHFASCVALFAVQQGTVQGLRCADRGQVRVIDGLLVGLDSQCMLSDVAKSGEAQRADPRTRVFDQRVAQLLGDTAVEVALFPVLIKGRVINVLYASNGQEALGEIAFGGLAAVALSLGAAYEELIRSRKTVGS